MNVVIMDVMTTIVTAMISNMEKENIIVSACLLGENCKYNGKNNYCQKVVDLKGKYNLITICPEVDGGLPIPRIPSEIVNDKVINEAGIDVTNEYNLGAKKALDKALENNVKKAILKAKSPSCGCGYIYDGSFTHTLIKGDGVTTKLFKENNIKVLTEEDL